METAFGDDADEPELILGNGDLSLDVPNGVVHVWWKGQPPAHVRAEFESPPPNIRVELHQSPYSSAELSAAEERIWDEDRPSQLAANVEAIVPTIHLDSVGEPQRPCSADR